MVAGVEVVTGRVLVIIPSPFGWLLFGAELSDAGQALGRLTGFTLPFSGFGVLAGARGREEIGGPGIARLQPAQRVLSHLFGYRQ